MKVITRGGAKEDLSLDKIRNRIKKLAKKYKLDVDYDALCLKTITSIYDGIHTAELDEESARIAVNDIDNPDMLKLASILIIDNHHKNTLDTFSEKVDILYQSGTINDEFYEIVMGNKEFFDGMINYDLDFKFDYFGFKTMEKAYLLRSGDKVIERPQDMFLREAIAIHKDNFEEVEKNYNYFSGGYMTHATPTLFHSGTRREQFSSCYLLPTEDSVEGLYKTVSNCATISQYAGGIGLHVSNVRANGSRVKGTNGKAGGLMPYLKVLNETAKHINQCFDGKTVIMTIKGIKLIENITTDDYVLAESGEYQKVEEVYKKYHGGRINKIYTSYSSDEVMVTDEHIFKVIKNNHRYTDKVMEEKIKSGELKEEFLPISQINIYDYIMYPKPKDTVIYPYTAEQTYIRGILYSHACGDMRNNYTIIFNKYTRIYNFFINYLCAKGIDFKVNERGLEFDLGRLGLTCPNRKVITEELNSMSNDLTVEFLKGYTLCFNDKKESYKCITTNKRFLLNLQYMYLKLGYLLNMEVVRGLYMTEIPDLNTNSPEKFNKDCIMFDDKFYCHLKYKHVINYDDDVFDLSIANNFTYTTSIGCVHNSGKRPGSFAIYVEPWHADIFEFLDMKKNDGKEEFRARDLFYALWIPDLFMNKVKNNEKWYLMCPNESPHLNEVYGDEFEELYNKYVSEGKYTKEVEATDLWKKIIDIQIETGSPYISYKDSANKKSNQKNIGTIKSSNLCVAPDTKILTSTGYYEIKDMVDKEVEVWNGEAWSKTTVMKTGENQPLLEITFTNGNSLKCTPYHKFYIQTSSGIEKVEASQLKKDYKLIDFDFPVIKKGLGEYKETGEYKDVPINYDLRSKILWFENLYNNHKGDISSRDKKFLKDIVYLLNTIGCKPEIAGNKLLLFVKDMEILASNGFNISRDIIEGHYSRVYVRVVDIEKTANDDTYCFTEKHRGMGVFNGILTGNCQEIMQYSNKDDISSCNLASIALPNFVEYDKHDVPFFNFQKLKEVSSQVCHNLNNIINQSFYPLENIKRVNLRDRPLGIGIQGLAYAYMKMRLPYDSPEAHKLNIEIFETIYYGSLEMSINLAKEKGHYETYEGSPFSQGKLQFDLWKEYNNIDLDKYISNRWDWKTLKENMSKYGTRNSLLTTVMPTASTAQILGNSEGYEPITSNMFVRRVLSGEFIVLNKYLVEDLKKLNLWDKNMKDMLLYYNGSVQEIKSIPEELKKLYKTVWEISQKTIIEQSAERAVFIDQSQSLNLFLDNPSRSKVNSMLFYGWSLGLKTGMYYLRAKSPVRTIQFTVDEDKIKNINKDEEEEPKSCPYIPGQAPEDCLMCSS